MSGEEIQGKRGRPASTCKGLHVRLSFLLRAGCHLGCFFSPVWKSKKTLKFYD